MFSDKQVENLLPEIAGKVTQGLTPVSPFAFRQEAFPSVPRSAECCPSTASCRFQPDESNPPNSARSRLPPETSA